MTGVLSLGGVVVWKWTEFRREFDWRVPGAWSLRSMDRGQILGQGGAGFYVLVGSLGCARRSNSSERDGADIGVVASVSSNGGEC